MCEEPWVWQREWVVPSRSGAGSPVLDELLAQLEQKNWGQHDLFGIHLATEEALVNAIRHGNGLDEQKHVRVACSLAPDLVRIEVADEGQGFDPGAIPDPTDPEHLDSPTGRGIMLMRSFMTRVDYNATGNRVVMEKQRHSPSSVEQAGLS